MSHTANVILTCDIEYKGKIIFKDKDISIRASVWISDIDADKDGVYGFTLDDWNSDCEICRANREGYLYSTILNEWSSDDEVESFEENSSFSDFTLLVKSEDCKDLELDYDMFDENY